MFEIQGDGTEAVVFVDDEDDLDAETVRRIHAVTNHPGISGPVRVMPDAHASGYSVVGFTAPMGERVIPQLIGGDIGCGMHAWRLDEAIETDAETAARLREAVPGSGRDADGIDATAEMQYCNANTARRRFERAYRDAFGKRLEPPFPFDGYDTEYFEQLCERVDASLTDAGKDAGTPGGGNHFVEFGKSRQTGDHWLVVHCGSRRLGKAVAEYWIDRADGHPEMGWLEGAQKHGYLVDMLFCQQYASWNRELIGEAAREAVGVGAVDGFESVHNYVDATDLVVRKGAARAHEGERLVVPLNAADGILLCEGRGNKEANRSAPHGAGRVLSRGDAKDVLNKAAVDAALDEVTTAGEVPVSEGPQAYKDADFLLRHLDGLAEPVDHLEPVLNLKHH